MFDPATDGIDFYESLEGMRVQVNDAVVVGPTSDFGEISVLADTAPTPGCAPPAAASSSRPDDFNPERIILDDTCSPGPTPDGQRRRRLHRRHRRRHRLQLRQLQALGDDAARRRVAERAGREVDAPRTAPGELAVATFNVENLDPGDPPAKFATLAGLIVNNLRSPDIVALEEIQDNNGADQRRGRRRRRHLDMLIAAIQAAGGPTYEFRQINPVDDQDGGEPGGNIRVGFLFRTDRGLELRRPPGGGVDHRGRRGRQRERPASSRSAPAGSIPTNPPSTPAASRWPASSRYNGQHAVRRSPTTSTPRAATSRSSGSFQPPVRVTEVAAHPAGADRRTTSSTASSALDPDANVVVLGDFNDFEFSDALAIAAGRRVSTT